MSALRSFSRWSLALSAVGCAMGCAGPGAQAPAAARASLAPEFARAFALDATGDPHEAAKAHLGVVQRAAAADRDPWQVPAILASLDALAERTTPSLEDVADDAALAHRTSDGVAIATALDAAARDARGPFARGLIERTLTSLAQRRGNTGEAGARRAETGCVRGAVVVGPVTWAPVTGVAETSALDAYGARLEPQYPSADAFGVPLHPTEVRARGCAIDLGAESSRPGVRQVVVDVTVPRAQTIGLVLRAHGAAILRAGGAVAIERPFELGDGEAARFATVASSAGTLRLTLRVGTAKEDDSVEIDVLDDAGHPLATSAPALGSTAAARASSPRPVHAPAPADEDSTLLAATADIAAGNPHDAERALWAAATRPAVRPDIALAYGRAVFAARDLSAATRAERARTAYEHVLDAWPSSWEARVAHAVLAGVRRGRGEAALFELADLDTLSAKASSPARPPSPYADAFEAMIAGREGLFDRAEAALARARPSIGATAFYADAEDAVRRRVGPDLVASACDLGRPTAHDSLECVQALRSAGDRAGEAHEIARLRELLGAPTGFLSLELHDALATGDTNGARRAFAAMLPADRTLNALAMLDGAGGDITARLLQAAPLAQDAPAAIAPLLRAATDPHVPDGAAAFDARAEQVAAQDRAKPFLPNADTAVLLHAERYELAASGLLHWTLFDVRRVNGTADVEENAQAAAPDIWARSATHALRRRILKKDGRILEPDRAPRASQAHADLSQLEPGDAIEAVYEGYALPGDTGDVGIDTPDLLPARTAVHEATIELSLPASVMPPEHASLWSHALLGAAAAKTEGAARLFTWRLDDTPARRLEEAVPKMDRNVSVSFSTARWATIARAVRETEASLDEHDPEIAVWAREAAAAAASPEPRAVVAAIVSAAGKALREGDAAVLSDFGGGISPVQTETARTFLTSRSGSRTWLVLRALRELGWPCNLVIAENDPYSADATFPPHFGRFVHPLLEVHPPKASAGGAAATGTAAVESGGSGENAMWVDADVAGPPLPAGRISPELRGRMALRIDGKIAPLPSLGTPEDGRDEATVRLALDPDGNARGTFAIALQGRDAQLLAEALFRLVGADRQRALRDVVLAWLPWADVDSVALDSLEGSWQVILRANVSVSGYAELEVDKSGQKTWRLPGMDALHWSWPHARASSVSAAFATRAARESALAVSTAVQYHLTRRIELPPGIEVGQLPGPVDVRSKLVEGTRTMKVGQEAGHGFIEESFVLGVTTGTIAPNEYERFVTAAHALDDGFLAATRLRGATTPR